MIVLIEAFALAEGVDRTVRVVGQRGMAMAQDTPETVYLRADWPTWFHERAVRRFEFTFEVTFPSAASLEAAEEAAHDFIATMPKGGTLTITVDGTETVYDRCVVRSAEMQVIGVTNVVRVQITAADPTTTPTPTLTWDGEILTWTD